MEQIGQRSDSYKQGGGVPGACGNRRCDGTRAVKMGWNPRANPAHHRFGPGWIEIFLQISIRVDF